MAKISLKKDYTDGSVLYSKDLNPNFETIETTINANDESQSETNASVDEALTQLSSDVSQAKTDIGTLQEDVTDLETAVLDIPTKTSELENDSGFITDGGIPTKTSDLVNDSGFITETDVPTKISDLVNDDNTVKDAAYVHTDNNFSDSDKSKLDSLNNYTLPIASASILGGIKLGEGLDAEPDGTVNVTGGTSGENGATFTPSVSTEGVISWTNDKNLTNPDPVNIKGPQGQPGEDGADGANGVDGQNGLNFLGYKGSVIYPSGVPTIGQEFELDLEDYTRTPVVGDTHFIYLSKSSKSYLATCQVTNVIDNVAEPHTEVSIVSLMETTGVDGANGANGQGVPTGGTIGQVLAKLSDSDFDTVWKDIEGGSIPKLHYLNPTAEEPIDLNTLTDTGIYICDGASTASTDYYTNRLTSNDLGHGWFLRLVFNHTQNINIDNYRMHLELASTGNGQIKAAVGWYNITYNNMQKQSEFFLLGANDVNSSSTDRFATPAAVNKVAEAVGLNGSNMTPLTDLQTTDKSSLVAAINEINSKTGGSTSSGDLIGEIKLMAATISDPNWLLCDGSLKSRTEYSELFAVIGTTYGSGDGSTTFNLPNISGRFPIGYDASDTDFNTIGSTGENKTHTQTVEELAEHNHVTDGWLIKWDKGVNASYIQAEMAGGVTPGNNPYAASSSTNEVGGGQPMDIMNPYIVMPYYIKAK